MRKWAVEGFSKTPRLQVWLIRNNDPYQEWKKKSQKWMKDMINRDRPWASSSVVSVHFNGTYALSSHIFSVFFLSFFLFITCAFFIIDEFCLLYCLLSVLCAILFCVLLSSFDFGYLSAFSWLPFILSFRFSYVSFFSIQEILNSSVLFPVLDGPVDSDPIMVWDGKFDASDASLTIKLSDSATNV